MLATASRPATRSSGTPVLPLGLLVVAIAIGVGGAGFAVLFRWLITFFTVVFTGHEDYAASPGAANPHVSGLGPWFVVMTPVLAGLLYGPLVHLFAREARGHGVPEVMYAVARHGGRIAPQVAAVKALASALCIGSGGSVGREGPIVQIGSALGSTFGRMAKVPAERMKLFVACGAAAGIAATFNAPLAGVFFALELILGSFSTSAFGLVVIAAVTSAAIGRAAFGDDSFLQLPSFMVHSPWEYGLYALLGVLGGLVGVGFTRILYLIEDICDWAWRGPEWLRPAVGGIVLGLLLLLLPQMYGVGYPVLGNAVSGRYAVGFLLVLLVGKIVATSLTIGIGGSGGVFAPSLFVGAMLGSAFGVIVDAWLPTIAGPAGAYGLIGMGAVFAGAARAPITAVIILFELTGEYSIILPMMAAIVVATAVSHAISHDSIYTLKLSRRGIDLTAPARGALTTPVREAMSTLPAALLATAPLAEAAGSLTAAAYGVLPVRGADGAFVGIITARAVAEALADNGTATEKAAIITELPMRVRESDPVETALEALTTTGCGAIPVFPDEGDQPVGWITYPGALQMLGGDGR